MSTGDRGVCVRCGAARGDFRQLCPACGHQPKGEGLLVAWLLSERHLDEAGMESVAGRIRAGESIRPSQRMLDRARKALGTHYASDPGLSVGARLALLATSFLLTPLPGWVLWAWWRADRPRAAWQVLGLSAPATVVFTVLVLWLRLG